jgi:hypothetical protein
MKLADRLTLMLQPHKVYSLATARLGSVFLGGLVVACLPFDPRFAGSNPAEEDGFFL